MKNERPQIEYSEYTAAKTLTEAPLAFGSAETVKAYDQLLRDGSDSNKHVNLNGSAADHIKAMAAIVSDFSSYQTQQKKIMAELKNEILDLIKSGDLNPYGFKIPRDSSDLPIKIPLDLFISGIINWDKSEIEFKNLEFAGIKLIENENRKIKSNKFQRSGNIVDESDISDEGNLHTLNPNFLINEKEAAKRLGISARTLQGLRVKGGGPDFSKLGQAVRYKVTDLIEWTEKNKKQNTI